MGIQVFFPNAQGRPIAVNAAIEAAGFCVHYVDKHGWRISRIADGRYLADFPTIEGAGFVLGALSRGIPDEAALRVLIESQGGRVPE